MLSQSLRVLFPQYVQPEVLFFRVLEERTLTSFAYVAISSSAMNALVLAVQLDGRLQHADGIASAISVQRTGLGGARRYAAGWLS